MAAEQPTYRLKLASTELTPSGVSGGGDPLAAATSLVGALGIGGGGASQPALLALRTDTDLATPAASMDAWFGTPAGVKVATGDAASLALGYGTSLTNVFSGTVDGIEPDLGYLRIRALSGIADLLRLRVNQVYENQSAGQIVSDLASQAGLTTGRLQDGLDLPFLVVDDSRSAYHWCRDLAERVGFDLYVTPAGELAFAAFDKTAADHQFTYARDVLSLRVTNLAPSFASVEVWGESPASSKGGESAGWLTRDFSRFVGRAGQGTVLRVSDPAVRTQDAAAAAANGRLAALTRQAVFGEAVVLGKAEVKLGDAVTFNDAPDERLKGVLQVKRVVHQFTKTDGFTTRLDLWGGGGGGLLGGLP
jgi:phage protein D